MLHLSGMARIGRRPHLGNPSVITTEKGNMIMGFATKHPSATASANHVASVLVRRPPGVRSLPSPISCRHMTASCSPAHMHTVPRPYLLRLSRPTPANQMRPYHDHPDLLRHN